jgi:flagellar biosynthesis protein FlhB
MAEDYHDKTEEPTPKKLADARLKGYAAKSQDLITSVHLIISILVFFFFANFMFNNLAKVNILVLKNLNMNFVDLNLLKIILNAGLVQILHLLLPLFSMVVAISFIMNLLQTGVILSSYPLTPKWSKLNVFNPTNYQHNFGSPAFVRLSFGILRLQIVLILTWLITSQQAFYIFNLGKGTAKDMLAFIKKESILVSLGIGVGYLFVGIGDLFYQKWTFNRKMRMSKREIKDELKQVEGDVNVKIKIRSSMRAKAQANAINLLPQANVLIADGSMYVVALAYKQNKTPLPLCLCKGVKARALVIRELAMFYSIPIVENPSVARKLFREVESGSYITPDLFQDVAAIFAQLE